MKYFFSYRFNERDGLLVRDTTPVAITRKAADVLRCLIDRAGTVVTHDTILSSVWPDAHVQVDNIKVLVRELRRAFDDDPHDPKYIRTDVGRGYAFVAPLFDGPFWGREDSATAPLVNRALDLSVLSDALAEAARAKCVVVVMHGERGMGKTAVCEAFMQHTATLPAVRICYGECEKNPSTDRRYSSVVSALDHLMRRSPSSIEPLLSRHAPSWYAHLRDRSAGGEFAAPEDRLCLVAELAAFLEALGEDGPTVFVLEDLHWADRETIGLIEALTRRHALLRTLFVVTYTRFPSTATGGALSRLLMELWSTGRCIRRELKPLGEDDVRAYLALRFGVGPVPGLAPAVHRLTGGNPLALRSVMDSLVDADILIFGERAWELRSPALPVDDDLPATTKEAIFWRFTHLETLSRVLLEAAAAVGPVFSVADLAAAIGIEALPRIERLLEGLAGRGYIERLTTGSTQSPRGRCYGFTHPLHAELLAGQAPAFDQVYDARRLGAAALRTFDRCS